MSSTLRPKVFMVRRLALSTGWGSFLGSSRSFVQRDPFCYAMGIRGIHHKSNNDMSFVNSHPQHRNISSSQESGVVFSKSTPIVNDPVKPTNTNEKNEEENYDKMSTWNKVKFFLEGYSSLSKFKLSSLVLSTTMVGYAMAPGPFDLPTFLIVTFGTGATICAANTINQIIEVNNDSAMYRTKNRWLPTQKISVTHAKLFAASCAISGVGSLCLINPMTASLALFNLGLYTAVYTPLKQRNPSNTWVGAIVGAIPPMIGWAAATGGAELGSWVIGAMLAFWQMPHFMALSYSLKDDYHRGGFKMLINTNPTKVPGVVLRYSLALMPIGALAAYSGMTTWWFALDSLIPAGALTYLAIKFQSEPEKTAARRIFKFSLYYLPAIMLLLLLHKNYSNSEEEETLE